MSLSPWDLSGNVGFDLDLYRPRRPSYVFATQTTRQRSGSYQHATGSSDDGEEEIVVTADVDFIDSMVRRKRKQRQESQEVEIAGSGVVGGLSIGGSVCDEYKFRNSISPAIRNDMHVIVSNHDGPEIRYDEMLRDGGGSGVGPDGHSMLQDLTATDSLSSVNTSLRRSHCDRKSCETISAVGGGGGGGARGDDFLPTDPDHEPHDELANSKWRYTKNLVVLSLSFILVFTAFRSIQNLQSSINTVARLGVLSMAIVHGTMFVSCIFAPVLVSKLTSKWTIVVGLLFYLFWIAANFCPHVYTLVPTSIGVGIGQSLAWGAQVSYIEKLAVDYAHLSKELTQQELYKFNGIFLACFQTSHIWGNLVSSLMLTSEDLRQQIQTIPAGNESFESDIYELDPEIGLGGVCGTYDRCNDQTLRDLWTAASNPVTFASKNVLKLMASYLVFAFTGFALIFLFLEKIGTKSESQKPCPQAIWFNVRQLFKRKTYRFLIPLLIFNGFEQGFVYADYTKSYITCQIGVEFIGYNMITLGMTNSIFSVLVGLVAKHIAREAIVGIGSVLHLGIMMFLLHWIPDQNLVPVFFVISALWGICDAIWQTQCNCLVNLSCANDHDVAFQNFRMLQGFGATMAFLLSTFTCIATKLYILISLLVLSIVFYVFVEYHLRRPEEPERSSTAAAAASAAATVVVDRNENLSPPT